MIAARYKLHCEAAKITARKFFVFESPSAMKNGLSILGNPSLGGVMQDQDVAEQPPASDPEAISDRLVPVRMQNFFLEILKRIILRDLHVGMTSSKSLTPAHLFLNEILRSGISHCCHRILRLKLCGFFFSKVKTAIWRPFSGLGRQGSDCKRPCQAKKSFFNPFSFGNAF